MPASPSRKDTSQPFPCMNNPCGCETAEQCWRGCCCLTAEQRWAWAEAHGIQPPDYAERPGESDHSCCEKGCCSHKDCCESETKVAPVRWVVGASVLRCRGLTAEWVFAGAVLPPEMPVTWEPRPIIGEQVERVAIVAFSLSEAPPAPPPR